MSTSWDYEGETTVEVRLKYRRKGYADRGGCAPHIHPDDRCPDEEEDEVEILSFFVEGRGEVECELRGAPLERIIEAQAEYDIKNSDPETD